MQLSSMCGFDAKDFGDHDIRVRYGQAGGWFGFVKDGSVAIPDNVSTIKISSEGYGFCKNFCEKSCEQIYDFQQCLPKCKEKCPRTIHGRSPISSDWTPVDETKKIQVTCDPIWQELENMTNKEFFTWIYGSTNTQFFANSIDF